MPYRYLTDRDDYADFASGKVFFALPGQPAFPVRLTLEAFQRGMALRRAQGRSGPVRLYDPCCGSAYHLSVLAYFGWRDIASIYASDIDDSVLEIARRNLSLLTPEGLDARIDMIRAMTVAYGKDSHADALAAAGRLRERLLELTTARPLPVTVFQADALQPAALAGALDPGSVDMALTDVPYGSHSQWQGGPVDHAGREPVWLLLAALRAVLAPQAVVIVAADKAQHIAHPSYRQAGKLKVGHRQVVYLLT